MRLSENALQVLRRRYLRRNERGEVVETPEQMFRRVAKAIARVERRYGGDAAKAEERFYSAMTSLSFLPNSPTLMNAGTRLGQLSACFTPEQPVLTSSGFRPICQIKVGDIVATHTGKLRRVIKKFERYFNGFIYKIKVRGLLRETLLVTPEHPILAVKKSNIACIRNKDRICNGFPKKYCYKSPRNYSRDCEFLNTPITEPKWIEARELEEGDYVVVSTIKEIKDVEKIKVIDFLSDGYEVVDGWVLKKNTDKRLRSGEYSSQVKKVKNEITVDKDLMLLFGYYLSEGDVTGNCVRFTLGKNESQIIDDINRIMNEKFGLNANVERSRIGDWVNLRFHSTIIAQFFRNIFGSGFDKKDIPEWILTLPPEKQFYLLVGVFRGDGCHYNSKKRSIIFLSLSNYQLSMKIWMILLRIGYPYNIHVQIPKNGTTATYRIVTSPTYCPEFAKAIGKNSFLERKTFPQYVKLGDYVLRRVDKIDKVEYSGIVYNLEVEEEHTYIAGGVAVHNCFVLPVEDSLRSIFTALKHMVIVQQSGGGTGFSFSKLRPRGDIVRSTMGAASGPVSFIRVFDAATEVIKQGGRRRGANMGILRVDHPDILEFIRAKQQEGVLENFNLSVGVTDAFMHAVRRDEEYPLVNPRNREVVRHLSAREVFEEIAVAAWRTGDPGLVFLDEVNRHNPTPELGEIESTNPCVTGDTLVATSQGLERISEIVGKRREVLVDPRLNGGRAELKPALRIFKTGVKRIYRLRTRAGYELRATAEHPVLTPEGWRRVGELRKGDRVLIQSAGVFNRSYELPFDVEELNRLTRRKLNLPERWCRELGQVLGWLVGDGALTEEKAIFYFGRDEAELLPYFARILNRWNACEVRPLEYGGVKRLQYHAKGMVEFFLKLGVKRARSMEKEVPRAVFTAPREAVAGFLQALFTADGTIGTGKNRGQVRLSTASEKLAKQVHLLLLNFGIKARKYRRRYSRSKAFVYSTAGGERRRYESRAEHYYELVITRESLGRFAREIGFLPCRKLSAFVERMPNRRGGFYRDVFEDEVAEVVAEGEEEVYDLTEPSYHSFIANGIVVHNCGEVPLLPYESCNLGSINLSRFVAKGEVDWEALAEAVRLGVHFLDNVIDANRYPLKAIERMTRGNRKIGLGVMGFAEMLIMLGLRYDSNEAVSFAEKLMSFIQREAKQASEELAEHRGSFPNIDKSIYSGRAMRNATVTTIAPTGTISIIAGTSSGIEPLFAVAFVREVLEGEKLLEVNPLFRKIARERGFYSTSLMQEIARSGSVQEVREVPRDVRELFVTALDIAPAWHVRMQAAFQKHVDNAVSKTINLPRDASVEDVRRAFMLAYKLKCKGITVYRYGSRSRQVLYRGEHLSAHPEYSGGCPARECIV
ncbi:MAG: hypothetical protein GXN98_02330 [Euryarchaeota archaeon]|nr:hypothetical protein [Euryarchaeota archaeon]